MHIRPVKILKVVKALTTVSLINEVSEFFLNFHKQGGGINKKGIVMKNNQNQPEKIKRVISMHIKFFTLIMFSKLKL